MAEPALEVHRNLWRTKDLALLCGIANAGGGRLVITPEERSRAKGVRKMHRAFEDIPTLTLQSFGFSCTTEPIMDGTQLCLQVDVPAAPEPLSFEGGYYLYGKGGNELLHGAALDAFLASATTGEGKGGPLPPPRDPTAAPGSTLAEGLTEDPAGSSANPQLAVDASLSSANAPATAQPAGTAPGTSPGATPAQAAPAPPARPAKPKGRPQQPAFKDRSIAAVRDIYLTSTDEYVLKILNANGRATAPKIATLLGVSESTVRRSFRHLREEGLITRIGSDKAGYWKVLI